jgi:hypothetical protein
MLRLGAAREGGRCAAVLDLLARLDLATSPTTGCRLPAPSSASSSRACRRAQLLMLDEPPTVDHSGR